MTPSPLQRICVTPQPQHVGGPASFIGKFSRGLTGRGIAVTHDLDDQTYQAILLVGASRQLVPLRQARRQGTRIVQRLDGMNWLHRARFTSPRHWLKAQMSNVLLAYTRERLASAVVYQSRFVQEWWQEAYGESAPGVVIHNGVDLTHFSPTGEGQPPGDRIRVLMVEGNLGGGYELGLEHAVALANTLANDANQPVELAVAGKVGDQVRAKAEKASQVELKWLGLLPVDDLPRHYRSAHLLFSGDINAACPNSVIEALACGLPVVAFDTGALTELVTADAGQLAAYGSDPWQLEPADIRALTKAAQVILADLERFRVGARARAEEAFGLETMVDKYLEVLGG
jgi:glycosyltransferase involved in cell wall biosynthesis